MASVFIRFCGEVDPSGIDSSEFYLDREPSSFFWAGIIR